MYLEQQMKRKPQTNSLVSMFLSLVLCGWKLFLCLSMLQLYFSEIVCSLHLYLSLTEAIYFVMTLQF